MRIFHWGWLSPLTPALSKGQLYHSPALPCGCQVYKDWAKSWSILSFKNLNSFRANTCAYWHLRFPHLLAVLCWMTLKSYNLCTQSSQVAFSNLILKYEETIKGQRTVEEHLSHGGMRPGHTAVSSVASEIFEKLFLPRNSTRCYETLIITE